MFGRVGGFHQAALGDLDRTALGGAGWQAINDYLNPRIAVLGFLVARLVMSSLLYTINAEDVSWTCYGTLTPKNCSRRSATDWSSSSRSGGSSAGPAKRPPPSSHLGGDRGA
jgi:hypothetical protein